MKGMKKVKIITCSMILAGLGFMAFEHPDTVWGNTPQATYVPSGIAKVEYQLTGAMNQDWTTINVASATSTTGFDLKLTEEGATHVLVAATDNAGNIAMEMKVFYVGNDGTNTPSPMKNIQYRLSGATTQGLTDYTAPFTVKNEGKTTVHITAEDMAGNTVTMTREVKIDKSSPINNGVTITLQ
ncbi:hypothetical protein JMA_41190 (plasmid) [Jeotgalibacillus malaysiensis]|uniref:Bacterial Ig domain-containing protein n=1 Tax=Jeotgalibacillus malaysiensis TaxID=1508404 RepID=A0A0B5ATL9_9BACL|nr:hypothetical protein [Jeotgalibacillus malaysiensis]AJD93436.1 hypothetical protein JMA_41190 [Jeotgalibacillus malaysiensis]